MQNDDEYISEYVTALEKNQRMQFLKFRKSSFRSLGNPAKK